MADNPIVAVWLRRLTGFLALVAVLALSACGGGSGAPNNPFADKPSSPSAVVALPSTTIAYSNVPTTITVGGGVPPYRAFSSNGTVLPVAQTVNGNTIVLQATDVTADTPVLVTVTDAIGQTAPVNVTVRPATLLNTFGVTPNRTECGATAICSGQTGVASIVVQSPTGAPIAGRQVRFDVVAGPFGILTNNPAQPVASTATVTTDATGVATVLVAASVDAPTQPAQIRATDLTSGQERTSSFLVIQNTNGATILTVVPGDATAQGAFNDECTAGARIDYYIYGGTPPYRVTASFPQAVTIVNPTVNVAGGFFEAITNGTCVQPLTFSILDATGRQTTATLNNTPGQAARPTPPVVAPSSLTVAPADQTGTCAAANVTFSLVVNGGTAPYNVAVAPSPGGAAIVVQQPTPSNGFVAKIQVNGQGSVGTANVAIRDNGNPAQTRTATINCI
jgi:hypothetical protein